MSPEEGLLIPAWFDAWVFVFGACLGSFLNVCIYRIPEEISVVTPRSRCPKCETAIQWYDNIPILSWLLLRGHCRSCKVGISPRYMLVEALTGILFLLVWLEYGWTALTPVYWLMVFGLILGTFVDFDHMILPDRVTLGGIVIGLILSPLVPAMHEMETPLQGLIASAGGAAIGFGLLWLVAALGKLAFKKDAMGFGDVKLLGALGAFLGWKGVLFTIMASAFLGSFVGIGLILSRQREWQSRIPYGPYIALAAVIWVLWGQYWWDLYVNYVMGGPLYYE